MRAHLGHMQVNIEMANLAFYKDLLLLLGWKVLVEDDTTLGIADPSDVSLWFTEAPESSALNYDAIGINHLAFHVTAKADVDTVAAYLQERDVELLFETPRERPEFKNGEHIYYQVMFHSPDNLLFEVVYMGPEAA